MGPTQAMGPPPGGYFPSQMMGQPAPPAGMPPQYPTYTPQQYGAPPPGMGPAGPVGPPPLPYAAPSGPPSGYYQPA